jgi:hypothetical protein
LRKVAPAKSNPCALTTMGKRRRAGCTARASACQVAIRTARRWWHDCPDISPLAYAIPAFWCPFRLAPKDFPDCAFYLSPDAVSNGRFTSTPVVRFAQIAVMHKRLCKRVKSTPCGPSALILNGGKVPRNGHSSSGSLPYITAGAAAELFPLRILALEPDEKVPPRDDYAVFRRRTGNDL